MTDLNNAATTPAAPFRVGRLAAHLDGFAALLGDQGYAPATIRQKVDLLVDFTLWVEEHNVPVDVLGGDHVGQFLAERRCRVRRGDAWTIRQLIEYLRDIGCIPMLARMVNSTAAGELVSAFGGFLRSERGLSPATLANYLPIVRGFLDEQFGGKALHFDDLRTVDTICRLPDSCGHQLPTIALRWKTVTDPGTEKRPAPVPANQSWLFNDADAVVAPAAEVAQIAGPLPDSRR